MLRFKRRFNSLGHSQKFLPCCRLPPDSLSGLFGTFRDFLGLFGAFWGFSTFRLFDFSTFRLFRIFDFSTFRLFDFSTFRLFDFSTFRLFDFSTFRLFGFSTVRLFVSVRLVNLSGSPATFDHNFSSFRSQKTDSHSVLCNSWGSCTDKAFGLIGPCENVMPPKSIRLGVDAAHV